MGKIIQFKGPHNRILKQEGKTIGIPDATTIACNYYCGKNGYPLDKEKAFRYFVIGANAGCTDAAWVVAYLYIIGEIVPQNIKKGIRLMEKECKRNNISALSYMAKCYEFGLYVQPDKEKAIKYYLKIKMSNLNKDNKDYIKATNKLYSYFIERKDYRAALFMVNDLESNLYMKMRVLIIKLRIKFRGKDKLYNVAI